MNTIQTTCRSVRAVLLGVALLTAVLAMPGQASADTGGTLAAPTRRPPPPVNTVTAVLPQSHDWYCGVGWQSQQIALCTDELAKTCNGTYSTKVIDGKEYGICHEKS